MTLHIGAFVWGSKYGPEYVDRLRRGVERNLTEPHRFHVWTVPAEDAHLTAIPGCFARLRAFSPAWQAERGIGPGDRIVVLDLDLIVTGSLDGLFTGPEPFSILQSVNSSNPCPYNGSVWSLDAGYRPDIWSEFTLKAASEVPFYSFPDDQAYLAARLPGAGAYGPATGVYAFRKPSWPACDALPANARIVAFPGHRDPSQFTGLDWVKENWR